jgi:hypothetical protein
MSFMSYDKLVKYAEAFEHWAGMSMEKLAEKSKKSKKKLNPKAKVRNRPSPAFSAESPKTKDDKDHYPLGDKNQALNAWARAHQTGGKAPSWFKGSYTQFLSVLKRKIHSKFPGIELSDGKKSKKSSLELLLEKYS